MSGRQAEWAGLSDDPTILDPWELWRRIYPGWWVPDQNSQGGYRLSTQAFEDARDGTPMSVSIAVESRGQASMLENHKGYGLASFTAGHARSCEQILQRAPTEADPAHAHVAGPKTKSVKRRLLSGTAIVVEPSRG